MKRSLLTFVGVALVAIGLVGCEGDGGGGGSKGGSPAENVAGTWQGQATGGGPTLNIAFNLAQDGNTLTGTRDGVAVTGTVVGDQVHLSGTYETWSGYSSKYGSFTEEKVEVYDMTVVGDSMSGTVKLQDVYSYGETTEIGSGNVTLARNPATP